MGWIDRARTNVQEKERKAYNKKFIFFFQLEYWKHLLFRHNLDIMHIEKNVCVSIMGTLLNIPGKTKNDIIARLDLVEMGVKKALAPQVGDNELVFLQHITI